MSCDLSIFVFDFFFFFFFSSRRRHTRYWRDWSSDVCSSDLPQRHPRPVRPDSARVAARRGGAPNRRDLRRPRGPPAVRATRRTAQDRKSTRLNSSHANISYAVFCLKKKKQNEARPKKISQILNKMHV